MISSHSVIRVQQLAAEAAMYGLLARALGSDVKPLYDISVLEDIRQVIQQISNPNLSSSFVKILETARAGVWSLQDLQLEHTRLFIKGEGLPYETSFDKSRPFGKSHDLADIAGFYRAFELKPNKEFPDYIVCELEFMSLLCLKESVAEADSKFEQAEICMDAQRKFINEHLGRWLINFNKHIDKCARLQVYPALIYLIRQFVVFHANNLSIKLPVE